MLYVVQVASYMTVFVGVPSLYIYSSATLPNIFISSKFSEDLRIQAQPRPTPVLTPAKALTGAALEQLLSPGTPIGEHKNYTYRATP